MTRPILMAALLAAAMPLAGCTEIDPLTREGLWQPTGANATNLRLMVAVPADLAYGVSARYADGHRAARAIDRLRNDRVYPLPDTNVSKIGHGSSTSPAPAAGVPE